MPKRYTEYRFEDPSLPYSDYKEMVQAAKGLIQEIQQEDYYNTLTLEKWTIAHTVGLAMVQLGFLLEGKKFHAESSMILLELGINRISTYEGLNFIESQMRKKAFWINLSSQRDSLADRFAFEEADAEHLYLLNLDDEVILPDRLQTEATSQTPLIAGLVASSRIHICLSSIIKESIPVLTTWSGPQSSTKRIVGNCECGRMISPVSAVEILNYRLEKVRGILDDLPSELHLPPQPSLEDDEKSQHPKAVRCMQYESMAANIHITALWAQSILLESIIAVSGRSKDTNAHDISLSFDEVWTQREKICRQVLSTIKRLSSASVEASGMILIYKIRQVAATLMEYPFGQETQISFNAELYSKAFAEHLSELYSSGGFPTQTGGEDEIQRYQTRLGMSENTGPK
ncbi:hypothetical protein FH972_024693 [Carpinus fangiana]|uniref:Transcription factor domain-containing protein n=1 Tax=Carpinus fangiana TaxID=176857 RepID=A0A5N6KZ26_9ROSI|nr:hypothetical protein FH972_024693 [Carpinus fangiana]